MTILVYTLHYFLTNISIIIQWFLFLIGLVLIILPMYHGFLNQTSSFLKASKKCKERLGMHRFINLYYFNNTKKSNENTTKITSNSNVNTNICLLSKKDEIVGPQLVSGLVNTGNSCFLNSVLQSLSSLPKLQTYLHGIDTLSTSADLPVTRSLLKTLRLLSVPSNIAFKPIELVSAMSSNKRVINREQQDAQELFQLISGELDNESLLAKKRQGFRDILNFSNSKNQSIFSTKERIDNPFTGLLANRLSCMQCGYTEAIRHFSFNNVQLTLPNSDTTTLDDCLNQLTTMEYLNDVTCRKCSLIDTVEKLALEIDALRLSKKIDKLTCLEKIKQDIENRLLMGRIQEEHHDDLKGFLSKVSRVSSKQAMFAKPPKVLCLHVARSTYLPTGEVHKNTCQIKFPQLLDLAPYCTNGTLNTTPHLPISTEVTSTVKYRLMSSIVHYGSHNFGHFIAYKRRLVAEKCSCDACCDDENVLKHHDSNWYKISDERVDSCTVDQVLEANPYMLLYELIDDVETPVTQLPPSPTSPVVIEQNDWTSDLPATPPCSPLILPLQLNCHSSFQPLIAKPRRNSNVWTQTPVAIY